MDTMRFYTIVILCFMIHTKNTLHAFARETKALDGQSNRVPKISEDVQDTERYQSRRDSNNTAKFDLDRVISETVALQKLRNKGDFRPAGVIAESLETPVFKDCADAHSKGWQKSGVYRVCGRDGSKVQEVLCDHNAGPGWRVIQLRKNGLVDFYRNWNEYREGFGDLTTEFWLGLDEIHNLTRKKDQKLRIEMETIDGQAGFVEYSEFWISDVSDNFRLHVSGFSGYRAGDTLSETEHGQVFSTPDKDNNKEWLQDVHCSVKKHSGWWHAGETQGCYNANLNGRYDASGKYYGIRYRYWLNRSDWDTWLSKVRMMIRQKK